MDGVSVMYVFGDFYVDIGNFRDLLVFLLYGFIWLGYFVGWFNEGWNLVDCIGKEI